MKKKILILSGSARVKGNSDTLCDQFMKGAVEIGHEVEKIMVAQKTIHGCTGCETCQENGGNCVFQDDMADIINKMLVADVIVLATPIYYYTMNGQLKTLIDRTYSKFRSLRNKEFYYIMAAMMSGESQYQKCIGSFRGFTDCLPGAVEKGIVIGQGAWKKGEIEGTKAMQEAYEFGKNA